MEQKNNIRYLKKHNYLSKIMSDVEDKKIEY